MNWMVQVCMRSVFYLPRYFLSKSAENTGKNTKNTTGSRIQDGRQ